ncbi:hypothetical protein O9X81_07150 [Agrobacterium salinitolerans]|uniref:hypothetical protein n=1 Tax=Agrobacterium salinitolerans TaxID=1183413 RepID=UPI0022B83988|nr:hypothetical protein [Agrobacterium salinitolerans]MCZ7856387.1 hypothetical protein [Agrobacterium salinitolerans]
MAKKEKSKKQKQKSASSAAELSGNRASNERDDLFRSIKEVGVVRALNNVKDGIADLLSNTDMKLATTLATVYAAAIIVQEDDDEWTALCEAKEWVDHPKAKPKRDDPLRATVRLAVGFDGPKSNSTVNRYITALQPLFEQEVPAAEIPDRIREAGGIEKMRQAPKPAQKSGLHFLMAPGVRSKVFSVAEETQFKARITVKPPIDGERWVSIYRLVPRKTKPK